MPILMKLKQGEALREEDVIVILQRREELLGEIEESKTRYMEEIKYLDMEIAKLEKIKFQTSDAASIKKREEDLRNEYKRMLTLACEMESAINHVWFHYNQLSYERRKILEVLYVSNLGWKRVGDELHIGRTKAVVLKNQGLQEIVNKINA